MRNEIKRRLCADKRDFLCLKEFQIICFCFSLRKSHNVITRCTITSVITSQYHGRNIIQKGRCSIISEMAMLRLSGIAFLSQHVWYGEDKRTKKHEKI